MTIDNHELYLIRVQLDAFNVYNLGRKRSLPLNRSDIGYLLHCYLKELFGENAPSPFSVVSTEGRWITLLGYGPLSAENLQIAAHQKANEQVYSGCRWDNFAGKTVPCSWGSKQQIDFEVRICPVVRKAGESSRHRKGAEVDAFLAQCWKVDNPSVFVDRYAVYRDWFLKQIESNGGAFITRLSVKSFKRSLLLRRDHEQTRRSHVLEKPDVTITGSLIVTDSVNFCHLVKRGIGRHRNFGFGMLLLKPGCG
jgi:CRISPR system Cascade subunit CasE